MALIRIINPASRYPLANKIWILLLLAFPLVLYMLPSTFFDSGQSICPSKLLLNLECLGCGMTRAVMHFHHLEFDEALYYNQLVFIVYPVLVILWGRWLYLAYKREKRFRTIEK